MFCTCMYTHINGNTWQAKRLPRRAIPGQIAIKLVAILVPFDRVQCLPIEIVEALQLRCGTLNHVIRYAHLQQTQSGCEICNEKRKNKVKSE